jgi:MFS transporter, MHS family, citrate/tricarballylate:H+ symporter
MAMGTILIAFVPAYATIGVAAPFLVLIGRLLQGFSAGVELGGVSVYLSEMATPGHKGFYVSWQSASQQVAIVVAALLGYGLNKWLAPDQISAWGWRIPFFIGCLIVPFIFVIRRSLQETEAFLARKHRPSVPEIFRSIVENWQIVLNVMGQEIRHAHQHEGQEQAPKCRARQARIRTGRVHVTLGGRGQPSCHAVQ